MIGVLPDRLLSVVLALGFGPAGVGQDGASAWQCCTNADPAIAGDSERFAAGAGTSPNWSRLLIVGDVASLLQAPSPAVLTTYRKDGTAAVSPVWSNSGTTLLRSSSARTT